MHDYRTLINIEENNTIYLASNKLSVDSPQYYLPKVSVYSDNFNLSLNIPYTTEGDVRGLYVDSSDNIFTTTNNLTTKYNSSGSIIATFSGGSVVYSDDVLYTVSTYSVFNRRDLDFNITATYSLGLTASILKTYRKYLYFDSIGNMIVNVCNIGPQGDPGSITSYGLRKYNSSGSLIWSINTIYFNTLVIDDDDNIYVGLYPIFSSGYKIRKYNSSGSLIWSKDINISWGQMLYHNGYIYMVGSGTITPEGTYTLGKYTLDGDIVWENNPSFYQPIGGITIKDDYIYIPGGAEIQGNGSTWWGSADTLLKIDLDGNIIWSVQLPGNGNYLKLPFYIGLNNTFFIKGATNFLN